MRIDLFIYLINLIQLLTRPVLGSIFGLQTDLCMYLINLIHFSEGGFINHKSGLCMFETIIRVCMLEGIPEHVYVCMAENTSR